MTTLRRRVASAGIAVLSTLLSTCAPAPTPRGKESPDDEGELTALAVGATTTSYLGCYTDASTRALPNVLTWSNSTVESCIAAAKSRAFAYAGLQYAGECWAGNTLGHTKVADSDCNMPCAANPSQVCGGPWRNSTYSTATLTPSSLWSSGAVPAIADSGPDNAVELGVKFRSDVAGEIHGIRFYKGTGNTGTHVGNLWTSTGTLLATARFTGETPSGWQPVSFTPPVAISANTVYVASYHTDVGHYSQDLHYFATAGVDASPLHAPASGTSGGNGVYAYGTSSNFPANTYSDSNYWVDVVLTSTSPAPPPVATRPSISPGTSTSSSPINATIACPSSGTVPYRTTDGSAPTTSSTQSSTAAFSNSGTLRAICAGSGYATSAEASATYTIGAADTAWVATDGASACTNKGTTACQYASCWNEPMPSTVYFFCDCQEGAAAGCVAGDNANLGTDPAAPKRTGALARFSSLGPGQAVALCRGGRFAEGGGAVGNTNGQSANPVILRDYKARWNVGTEGRPIMRGISFDPVIGVRAINIDFVGGGGCGKATDLTLCNTVWRDAGDSGFYESGAATDGVRVKAIGSLFLHNNSQGWLGSGQETEIRNSFFYNNGVAPMLGGGVGGMFGHSLYLGGGESAGEIVSGNEFHPPAGAGGTTIGIHGTRRDMLFENNLIISDIGPVGDSNYGIGSIPGYQPRLEYNANAIFRGNTIINAGGHSIAVAICQNCLIENNVVINTQRATSGIMFPERAASGSEQASTAGTIRNNTIYLTAGGTGIQVGGEGTGHVVVNNAVHSNGTCYGWGGSVSAFAKRDYNASDICADAVVGSHSWKGDPQWVAPVSNFHPSVGSPLLGAGDSTQQPTNDAAGATRQTPPSIGAYDR